MAPFLKIAEQYEFRLGLLLQALEQERLKTSDLDAVVSRGGMLPPVEAGAYQVNEDMAWQLKNAPVNEHASSLGAMIAYEISGAEKIPAYIYDCVTVDEMIPITRISGNPLFEKSSMSHHLNMRVAGTRYVKETGKPYDSCTLIIAHLGGGISVSLHHNGKTIDIANNENGALSPERAGVLPCPLLVKVVFSGQYDRESLLKLMKSQGGLLAYLGTNDSRKVEEWINGGDEYAKLIY